MWGNVSAGVHKSNKISNHGLRRVKGNRKRTDDDEIIQSLHAHFKVLMSYDEVEAMRFAREKTGEVTEHGGAEDTLYLPSSMGKIHCYRRWCADCGWNMVKKSNGANSLEVDGEFDGEQLLCVAWSVYFVFWGITIPNLRLGNLLGIFVHFVTSFITDISLLLLVLDL